MEEPEPDPEPERPEIRMQETFTPPTAEQRAQMQGAFKASQGTPTRRPEIKMQNRSKGPTAEQRAKMQEHFRKQSGSGKGKACKMAARPSRCSPGTDAASLPRASVRRSSTCRARDPRKSPIPTRG